MLKNQNAELLATNYPIYVKKSNITVYFLMYMNAYINAQEILG